jgi:hypothetical protein
MAPQKQGPFPNGLSGLFGANLESVNSHVEESNGVPRLTVEVGTRVSFIPKR